MKLLVFAHTPPPHHGQSFMVQKMLEGFGGDWRKSANRKPHPLGIQCYHINSRVSKQMEDVGEFRMEKFLLTLGYCAQAIYCRFRYGVTNLYFVPAPGKRTALYRDWLVMTLCRPFFKRLILHWHASGLGKWLETVPQVRTRSMTFRLIGRPDLSVVLANHNVVDATKLWSRAIRVVGNGIPDPCPEFDTSLLPRRLARHSARQSLLGAKLPLPVAPGEGDPGIFRVLYLAHCTREKGLFDAVEAIALANVDLKRTSSRLRMELLVAGEFMHSEERNEFDRRIAQPDLQSEDDSAKSQVKYVGFVTGAQKQKVFSESDCFLFPTYYSAESFGLVIVEAMAFGLPVVATAWRSLPELLPVGYPGLVEPRRPDQLARALIFSMQANMAAQLRQHFLENFMLEKSLKRLSEALRCVEEGQSKLRHSEPPPYLGEHACAGEKPGGFG